MHTNAAVFDINWSVLAGYNKLIAGMILGNTLVDGTQYKLPNKVLDVDFADCACLIDMLITKSRYDGDILQVRKMLFENYIMHLNYTLKHFYKIRQCYTLVMGIYEDWLQYASVKHFEERHILKMQWLFPVKLEFAYFTPIRLFRIEHHDQVMFVLINDKLFNETEIAIINAYSRNYEVCVADFCDFLDHQGINIPPLTPYAAINGDRLNLHCNIAKIKNVLEV